ncbi:peptidylprolyl isomerase [Pelistega sp. MC2]|uniref:peptidylprolyl isomerase n=1 Tax=Pelistega sp. MC2 TaxID=1720297 RepID=UPI0008DB20E1|nr:peptidylprolyl isomerase [Pelistega sp. MC2]
MNKIFLVIALCLSNSVFAQNVATINGNPITKDELDSTLKSLRLKNASAEQRQAVLNELISRDVLVLEAKKQGIDKKESIKMAIETARKEILINSLLQDWSEKNKITADDIKKAYDETIKSQEGKKEYKVRHILVKDEAKALELSENIKANKISFEDAAIKESIDQGSAKKGGDLGWANPEMFLPEFGQAIQMAHKGEMTAPVKSQYGYHLIIVDDLRPIALPSLQEATPEIQRILTQKKMLEYVEKLRSKTKIVISDEN